MSCYKSASATVISGTTGYVLVVKVEAYSGIVPFTLEKGTPPFNPPNVFPVIISNTVPSSANLEEKEVQLNLNGKDEFVSVELICENKKPGTIIPLSKKLDSGGGSPAPRG